jgi:hypothetical protein
MKTTEQDLKKLYRAAEEAAERMLIDHLMYMFDKNKRRIGLILNCMGSTAFYNIKDGQPLWRHQEKKLIGYNKLCKILSDWDDIFKLTGYPIKVDKTGVYIGDEF